MVFNKQNFFYVLTIATVILSVFFIRSFITTILLTLLTVIIFTPVYNKSLTFFKGKVSLAITATLTIITLSFILPVAGIFILSFQQAQTLRKDIDKTIQQDNATYEELIEEGIIRTNQTIDQIGFIDYELNRQDVVNAASRVLRPAGEFIINNVSKVGGTILDFFTHIVIYYTLLATVFPHKRKLYNYIKGIIPLEDTIFDKYSKKIISMSMSMVKGTFVIGVVQGVIGGIFLWIAGVPYVFFLTLLLILLAIIPVVGSGLVTIPVGVILILTGNVWQGIFVLATHFIIIVNIDNVLRPRLVSDDARIPAAILLIGVFAGISAFGLLGVIFGPVIMIFLLTTLETYKEHYNIKSNQ